MKWAGCQLILTTLVNAHSINCFSYELFLTRWLLDCAAHNRPWQPLAFLPLLKSSLLTKIGITYTQLLQRKRPFIWCPDRSDQPNGAWDMHKNAQKVERKTQSKISCHYTWLNHGKNYHLDDTFLEVFYNRKQASKRSITAAKRKEKQKNESKA